MADDPSQSVADLSAAASAKVDPTVTDPNSKPPAESASAPADRPVSTILADSPGEASAKLGSPTEPKTPLADSGSDYTVLPTIPDESTVATESASVVTSLPTIPADAPTEASAGVDPVSVAPAPADPSVPSETSAPSSPPEATSGGSIQDSLPPDQPSQVQPSTPNNASDVPVSQEPKTPPQSAGIKPEPLEGTQNAPLADPNSPKTSFGDILVGTGEVLAPAIPVPVTIQPPSPPASEPIPSTPITSFGDLTGKPSAEEPTINIEPIEPPKSVQSPLPSVAPAKEGQSPQSPLSPQPQIETVIEAKADFSAKRQQALQTRRKKRDDHLAKILALISQKGKIHNKDICALLRVSQSTATNYLHSLVKDGKIKKEGKAKATIYSF